MENILNRQWGGSGHTDWASNSREPLKKYAKLLGDFVVSNIPVHSISRQT